MVKKRLPAFLLISRMTGPLLLVALAGLFASPAQAAAPVLDSFTSTPAVVAPGAVATLNLAAYDPDCADTCTSGCGLYIRSDLFSFSPDGGTILSTEPGPSSSPFTATGQWQAPLVEGVYSITAYIADSGGFMCGGRSSISAVLEISVSVSNNQAPAIDSLTAADSVLYPGESTRVSCSASDPDGDLLTYEWQTDAGSIAADSENTAILTSDSPALATVTCTARDPEGASASANVFVSVSAVLAEKGISRGLATPQRLAVDSMASVFVADPGRGGLVALNLFSGEEFFFIPMVGVSAVDVDWADNLVVAARDGVVVMTRHGEVLLSLQSSGRDVVDVAVDPVNRLYGVLHRRSGRVKIYDETGTQTLAFGASGDGVGQFKSALGLAATPVGGAWSAVHWLVTDAGHGQVQEFDGSGSFVRAFGQLGGGAGEFVSATDVLVGADDLVYVSDTFQSWVQTFNPDGSLREAFGGHGDDLGQFKTAVGMALATDFDRMLVASVNGGRVQVFTIAPNAVVEGPRPLGAWTPESLDFGAVELGASASLSTVLTNIGDAPMGRGKVTVLGDFLSDHDCPALMDPGQWCTFTVTFAPTDSGAISGALLVETSASAEPLQVAISGSGVVPPSITVQPASLDFAMVEVGTVSSSQVVTLANQGPSDLAVYGVQVAGPYTLTHDCPTVVPAGSGCLMQVSFAPLQVGAGQTGSVNVLSNALNAPHQVALQGAGVPAENMITMADVQVDEDAGEALFTVSLGRPADAPVSVDYTTEGLTATADEDFLAAAGTATVPAGQSSAAIAITLVDDDVLESEEENFRLVLSGAVNGILVDNAAVATVVDDEICFSPNLLQNGSAEEPVTGNSIPGWTAAEGIWLPGGPEPAPVDGAFYFSPDGSSLARVEQIVDISRFMAASPALPTFDFKASVRTADPVSQDSARIHLEFLHASTGAILESWDSGEIVSPLAWVEIGVVQTAPEETGWIRVQLISRRVDGTTNDGIYDDLQLRSLRIPTVSVRDAEVVEGAAGQEVEMPFALELSCSFHQPVTVQRATVNGTAVEVEDYASQVGPAIMAAGTVESPNPVVVYGDDLDEAHEDFYLQITGVSPVAVVVMDARGTGTITNDDFCPQKAAYWKKHDWLWPVETLELAGVAYSQNELIVFLGYTGADESSTVARELTAAKLNLAAGSSTTILPEVAEGDDYLASFPPGSDPDATAREWGRDLTSRLNAYNTQKCD